jgi:hypothetical protein
MYTHKYHFPSSYVRISVSLSLISSKHIYIYIYIYQCFNIIVEVAQLVGTTSNEIEVTNSNPHSLLFGHVKKKKTLM